MWRRAPSSRLLSRFTCVVSTYESRIFLCHAPARRFESADASDPSPRDASRSPRHRRAPSGRSRRRQYPSTCHSNEPKRRRERAAIRRFHTQYVHSPKHLLKIATVLCAYEVAQWLLRPAEADACRWPLAESIECRHITLSRVWP